MKGNLHHFKVDSKLWRLDEDTGIIHSKTGCVMEIHGSTWRQGTHLDGGPLANGPNQKFSIDGFGSPLILRAIRAELNDYVFDVEEGLLEVGSAIVMWPHHGGDNQIFRFVHVS